MLGSSTGRLEREDATGRVHASLAFPREIFDRIGGWVFDIALFATAESLRSRMSAEVAAAVGVVVRGFRWLQIPVRLKARRSGHFIFAKTA